jgi:hypothetical protein
MKCLSAVRYFGRDADVLIGDGTLLLTHVLRSLHMNQCNATI